MPLEKKPLEPLACGAEQARWRPPASARVRAAAGCAPLPGAIVNGPKGRDYNFYPSTVHMTPEESDSQQRKCLKSVDFGLFGIFVILAIFVRVLDAWDFGCLWFL